MGGCLPLPEPYFSHSLYAAFVPALVTVVFAYPLLLAEMRHERSLSREWERAEHEKEERRRQAGT